MVTFDIDGGPLYRTDQIAFSGNHVFSAEELRSMFKVKVESGDIFSPVKIRQALEQMRSAYVQRHYLNFTMVPETNIDDSRRVISVGLTGMKASSSTRRS